ncbi:hypothetical protein RWE15_04320 [Virgibacillus halophilus]|uniref:Uncharacterized protein n=1 Tax=Tigheibacillus halophilus TaxID=361280 RepID=A0ABU5C4N4_9BACI|nr:hypothetical protein [Virgibacillus halophilus]
MGRPYQSYPDVEQLPKAYVKESRSLFIIGVWFSGYTTNWLQGNKARETHVLRLDPALDKECSNANESTRKITERIIDANEQKYT